jgi:tetratricopeptide (TPR) repeat protein
VDLISGAANVVGIAGAAAPLMRRGAVEREVHECLTRALTQGFAEQGLDNDRGASASLVADAVKPKRAYSLLAQHDEQLAAPDRVERWSRVLQEVIPALDVLDDRAVDIPRLARQTARLLATEIDVAARRPGSDLAMVLLLARSAQTAATPADTRSGAPEEQSTFVRSSSGAVSNIATLPLSEQPVPRPEQGIVEKRLSEHRIAVIAGGPGAGKSVLAEMTAHAQGTRDPRDLLWWVNAKTPQHLIESCEEMLLEFGEQPTGDLPMQVRAVLARVETWLVVVDDAPEFDAIRTMIPAEHAGGVVLVTTRSAASFPRYAVVQLDTAEDATLREIARRRLPEVVSERDMDELLGACAENPLIVSTACGYLAETGISIPSMVALMRSSPTRVLAGGSAHSGFVGVLSAVRDNAREPLSWDLLVAVAVSGGTGVPRQLFEEAFGGGADASTRVDGAFRELIGIGVVRIRDSLVQSHALTATVVVDLAEPVLRAESAGLLIEAILSLVEVPGRRLLPGLAAVIDAVESSLPPAHPSRVLARILLAERLAEQGLSQSAYRQMEIARAVPFVSGSPDVQQVILQSEARVHLLAGDSVGAKRAAERVAADSTAPRALRAAAHVTLAWAADALGDRAGAQASIAETLRLVPDEPGVQALHDHFFILDAPATERVDRYLTLAEESTEEMRGHFLTMASRSCIDAGRPADAVAIAQRAVSVDRAVGGERSLHVARDLNDLGMALIAHGQLAEAAAALEESIQIYREEHEAHSHVALPLLHLGRVLTQRARETDPPDADLVAKARGTLDEAIALQRLAAPDSDDHASLLYARGDVLLLSGDNEGALEAFLEAARIDRDVYGDGHPEVGIDVARVMDTQLMMGDPAAALRSLETVRTSLQAWEQHHSDLVLRILCMQVLARYALSAGLDAEAIETVGRIEVLSTRPEIADDPRSLAESIIAWARRGGR